ncbi:MAG TPA: hypothetical protein VFH78_02195 [Candidatus Thermoplasmatota archaeon]|nr:hypothetical protein [Candidatus Thermoplasmatota archaeon]
MRGIAIALALAGGVLLTFTGACAMALRGYGDATLTTVLIVMAVLGVLALTAGLSLRRDGDDPP